MPNIKITIEGSLVDGHKITFKAPCNCDVVEKLDVRYIENNTQKSRLFTLRDSHGNDLTGLGNLFSEGAYVDVVLDINKTYAYVQNASTNTYLEGKITPVDNLLSDSADLPLSAKQGKVLKDSLGSQIRKIVEVSVESDSLASNSSGTKTVNLTSYGFVNRPVVFAIGTRYVQSWVSTISTTQMVVGFHNPCPTARSGNAYYNLVEFK